MKLFSSQRGSEGLRAVRTRVHGNGLMLLAASPGYVLTMALEHACGYGATKTRSAVLLEAEEMLRVRVLKGMEGLMHLSKTSAT